jgi:arabinose-5-phosphate isomerase
MPPDAAERWVSSASRVLRREADGLLKLAETLPRDFSRAVSLILAAKGRVIVSGIGKSGHVGCKIAATLASTGTPAFFVHPSEASHGDLGMIKQEDVLLLISNSGETAELRDLLAYARRFSVRLIGVSRCEDSTLMRAADLRLILPHAEEACAIGMAPTTSTTMTMALGDALAVALMEARGFAREDFREFHPGGKLGAQLSRVGQLMHDRKAVPVVAPETPMSETLLVMTAGGFGIAAVENTEGRLAGIVTDGDLRRHMDSLMDNTAGDVATADPVTIGPDTLAADALAVMNDRKITVLLVVDAADRPVGVLHIHDLLRAGVA